MYTKSEVITLKIQMIFCHKLYYNLNYTNLNKKEVLVIYALNPKKLYKLYKLYNAKQTIFKKNRKTI